MRPVPKSQFVVPMSAKLDASATHTYAVEGVTLKQTCFGYNGIANCQTAQLVVTLQADDQAAAAALQNATLIYNVGPWNDVTKATWDACIATITAKAAEAVKVYAQAVNACDMEIEAAGGPSKFF
jgi:hypothetical protein